MRCRLHNPRHTFATRLGESGVSESTMLALMGHVSSVMLERYSRICSAAKREAIGRVTLGTMKPRIGTSPCRSACGGLALVRKVLKNLVSAVGIEPTT